MNPIIDEKLVNAKKYITKKSGINKIIWYVKDPKQWEKKTLAMID